MVSMNVFSCLTTETVHYSCQKLGGWGRRAPLLSSGAGLQPHGLSPSALSRLLSLGVGLSCCPFQALCELTWHVTCVRVTPVAEGLRPGWSWAPTVPSDHNTRPSWAAQLARGRPQPPARSVHVACMNSLVTCGSGFSVRPDSKEEMLRHRGRARIAALLELSADGGRRASRQAPRGLCWGGQQEGPPYHTGDQETAPRECKHHPRAPGIGGTGRFERGDKKQVVHQRPRRCLLGRPHAWQPPIAARCPGHGIPCPLDTPTAGSPETNGDTESPCPAVDPRDCTKIRPPALSPSPTPGSGGPSGALLPSVRSLCKIQTKTCCWKACEAEGSEAGARSAARTPEPSKPTAPTGRETSRRTQEQPPTRLPARWPQPHSCSVRPEDRSSAPQIPSHDWRGPCWPEGLHGSAPDSWASRGRGRQP